MGTEPAEHRPAHRLVAALELLTDDGRHGWLRLLNAGSGSSAPHGPITWVTSYLRLADRTCAVLLGVFCADCVVEVTGITVQVWRHVPSHFNNTTPANAVVADNLAVGGAVLIGTLGTFAVTASRGRTIDNADAGMRLALRAGFGLLIAGLAVGVAMIVKGEWLIFEGHRELAYRTAGFLKWFHAITLHAVLLPALAWLLANRPQLDQARRHPVVALATAAYLTTAAGALLICFVRA